MQQLDVTYENIPVPNSPFRVNAKAGCDPKRVRAYGPGLESGTTNEATTFTIETKGAGQGSLGLAIEGPSEAKMVCKDNLDGVCVMEYLPVNIREHRLRLLSDSLHIHSTQNFFRLKLANTIFQLNLLINMYQVNLIFFLF